jgi:hypothetical protein
VALAVLIGAVLAAAALAAGAWKHGQDREVEVVMTSFGYSSAIEHLHDSFTANDDGKIIIPEFDPAFTELVEQEGREVWHNRSQAVLKLEMFIAYADSPDYAEEMLPEVYPNFNAACRAAAKAGQKLLPSVDLIDAYTKYCDDRIVAALEQHISGGGNIFPGGKQGFLRALLAELLAQPDKPGRDEAAEVIAAALSLGGDDPLRGAGALPATLQSAAAKRIERFQANPLSAKPIGIYGESPLLGRIFQRDRFLQAPFGTKLWSSRFSRVANYPREGLLPAVRMAQALKAKPELLAAYTQFLRLGNKLSDPSANLTLLDLLQYEQYFGDERRLAAELR